jgi:hypothetical protein
MQLGEQSMWQHTHKQVNNDTGSYRHEITASVETMMYSRSIFLLRGSTSYLERSDGTKFTNATKAHLILRVFKPQRRAHNPLITGHKADDRSLYKLGWSSFYNLIGGFST